MVSSTYIVLLDPAAVEKARYLVVAVLSVVVATNPAVLLVAATQEGAEFPLDWSMYPLIPVLVTLKAEAVE